MNPSETYPTPNGLPIGFDNGFTLTNERTYVLTNDYPDSGLFSLVSDAAQAVDNPESSVEKFTEASILDAVQRHFAGRGALLRQVTLEDGVALARWESAVDAGERVIGPTVFFRRIDGLLMIGMQRTAIEVKISRDDFKNDTYEKTRVWREHAHRFVYVTPKGLLKPSQMVDGAGLWEWDGKALTIARRPKVQKVVPQWPDGFVRTLVWRAAGIEAVS